MTRPARTSLALAAVALALAGDVWFIRRAEPHSVAEFNPFKTRIAREELVLSEPVSQDGPLFSHQGGKNEVVDVFFDKGIVSEQTARLLRLRQFTVAGGPQAISYTTLDSPATAGPTCRTFVNVSLQNSQAAEIRLLQTGLDGGDQHREIEIEPAGAQLVVDFWTEGDLPGQTNQPGCKKLLQMAQGQVPLSGVPLKILAAAGSSVRLKFMPASSTPIWDASGLIEPFQAINVSARGVMVSPLDSPQKLRSVDAVDGRASIHLENLLIGSKELQARLSGVGMIAVKGHLIAPRFEEWVSASYGRTGMLALFNLLVLCAAVFFAMGGRIDRLWRPGAAPAGPEPDEGDDAVVVPDIPTGPQQIPPDGLVVFLCHCSENKAAVRELKAKLEADGFRPWLDEQGIRAARRWEYEIEKALRRSHAIVVCLSTVFERKVGFVHKELRWAQEIAAEQPEGAIFLIPLRLEECRIPHSLEELQYIDLFTPAGYGKLKGALLERARQVGIKAQPPERASA